MMHGFLNIDKPTGLTSHDVVARVRRIAGTRRVGHAGTLDPAATGVLVVALGVATRLIEYVQDHTSKRYCAVVRLGVTTTADDAAGEPVETRPVPPLDEARLEAALLPFRGAIRQVPPAYSAIHYQGRRLYDLARAGVAVDVPARAVVIERLDLIDWRPPLLTLDVLCGKGTYIRALARDLGATLGCGAHLHTLRRTAVGPFQVEDAVPLHALDKESAGAQEATPLVLPSDRPPALAAALLPPEVAVADWPRADLDAHAMRRVRDGMAISLPGVAGSRLRAHGPDGALLALLRLEGEAWRPEKVLNYFGF